ncbi:MAG: riboflavin synthase [Deltaproteobacteria bacterium]|nr:riboflavin synthase [Deltaproteobacteria bacterium]MBW1962777.1 riboflavin synthase [Deltaproteobacteria bacterium]MBW1995376.1 riboflavin synthase [Deltaproteobacteria bacterium]MBW2153887.1 riboflavin synthase [Deltaproteobacteria bacterium]
MFTGIIEGQARVSRIQPWGSGRRISFEADFLLEDTRPGESIAVDGVCLTVTMASGMRFAADLSPETLSKTTLGSIKIGDRINLERALRFSDRLGGHLVAGHVDGIGRIVRKEVLENFVLIQVSVPESLDRYLIEKGSVAVDGVSLTINDLMPGGFSVSVIPHTAKLTTLGFKKVGDPVNIETDMIGKYVERFLSRNSMAEQTRSSVQSTIDIQFLEKTGFIKP